MNQEHRLEHQKEVQSLVKPLAFMCSRCTQAIHLFIIHVLNHDGLLLLKGMNDRSNTAHLFLRERLQGKSIVCSHVSSQLTTRSMGLYELIGLDIECNILPVAYWQPRFALSYTYSVNHIWTCGFAGSGGLFESMYTLDQREKGKDEAARDRLHMIMLLKVLEPVAYVGDRQLRAKKRG